MKNLLSLTIVIFSATAHAQDFTEVVLKSSAQAKYAAPTRQGELIKLTAYTQAEKQALDQLATACGVISGMIKPNTLSAQLQDGCEMDFVDNKTTQATCQFNAEAVCVVGSTF